MTICRLPKSSIIMVLRMLFPGARIVEEEN
jgi:hypothetical protein